MNIFSFFHTSPLHTPSLHTPSLHVSPFHVSRFHASFFHADRGRLRAGMIAGALAAVLCTAALIGVLVSNMLQARYVERIADQVLRFHVIANSDNTADQELKLAVRDALVAYMAENGDSFANADEAAAFAAAHCDELAEVAAAVIRQAGQDYPVSASVTWCSFPDKTYGNLTFPAGSYRALQVKIGEAAGQNWWCVLYPLLCFTDEGTVSVPEDSQERLQEALGEEDYERLENAGRPQLRFKLLEWLEELF